jgi:hypothetical protein
VTILRIFVLYKPLRFFAFLGVLSFLPGAVLGVRFLLAYFANDGAGHIQSLILAAIFVIGAAFLWIAGILSDLVAANRVLLEEIRFRVMRLEAGRTPPTFEGLSTEGHSVDYNSRE